MKTKHIKTWTSQRANAQGAKALNIISTYLYLMTSFLSKSRLIAIRINLTDGSKSISKKANNKKAPEFGAFHTHNHIGAFSGLIEKRK